MPTRFYRWPLVQAVCERALLLDQMLARLGVPLAAFAKCEDGSLYRRAREQCLRCGGVAECRETLMSADGLPLPPAYCPNRTALLSAAAKARAARNDTA
jgi:hypothetical protein